MHHFIKYYERKCNESSILYRLHVWLCKISNNKNLFVLILDLNTEYEIEIDKKL